MKKALNGISVLFGLMILPFQLYGGWLLYTHVKATELMWFIWWVSIPFLIITQIAGQIAKTMADKE